MKLEPKLVKFLCCGDAHLFTEPREFYECVCGSAAFDMGDGFYCRTLGDPKKIKFLGEENGVS